MLEHPFLYGVFHGDVHAGNVLIDELGGFSLVDFGIAGRLDASQRAALARLVIGFAHNDYAAQVTAVAELGALPPGDDLEPLVRQFAAESTELLAEHRFRQAADLLLVSENALYLNGLCIAFAPT